MDHGQVRSQREVKTRWRLGDMEAFRAKWRGLGNVVLIFLLSRLAFYSIAYFAHSLLLTSPIPGDLEVGVGGPPPLAMHWKWDAFHYYSIAVGGYPQDDLSAVYPRMPVSAFFPLWPLLIRETATLLSGLRPPAPLPIAVAEVSTLVAGVVLAHVASLLAFWLLYQLVRDETGDEAMAQRAVLYTAIFPLAFFYAIPYTEALFLLTSIGVFKAAQRAHWIQAGLWAAAASATRIVGLLLLPVLALEIALAWRRGELRRGDWGPPLLGLLLAPSGLLLFMVHLWQQVGDPLAWINAQSAWTREYIFPLMTLWRAIDYAFQPGNPAAEPVYHAVRLLQLLIVLGFLAVLVASFRQWRPSYTLYGLLLFILILSAPLRGGATMESAGRYAMVLFPVYLTLAHWGQRTNIHLTILLLWLPLFGLFTALYIQWYWVA